MMLKPGAIFCYLILITSSVTVHILCILCATVYGDNEAPLELILHKLKGPCHKDFATLQKSCEILLYFVFDTVITFS